MSEIKAFDKKIWLSSPTMHGDELKYMEEAYNTNWMSTVGENINELESIVCQNVGAKNAVALSSGTAALHLAIKLADVKPGDKVFCTDLTFIATANCITYEGGIPVFIDTEYDTWNMDPISLKKAFELYPETRVVVISHLYGVPGKIDEIRKICDENNAILIEDAAESLGAKYKGKQTGIFGKYNCLSFNGNKIITGSSGGMLLTDSLEDAKKAKKLSTQARENVLWYEHEEIGFNYRMSNVIAGIVRGQFPYLNEHIAKKKAIYERYKEGLKNLPIEMNPIDLKNSDPNYWLSCLLIKPEAMCNQVITENETFYNKEEKKTCPLEIIETLNKYNVESRFIFKPMHMQPLYKNNMFIKESSEADVGKDIFRRGVCLPSDIKMTEEEQDIVIQIIKNCFK